MADLEHFTVYQIYVLRRLFEHGPMFIDDDKTGLIWELHRECLVTMAAGRLP